ncbi:YusW family protein [Lederbergia citrea]|uniref:YusW family protein n=2 Tax=Lederbergia citrea TaxID=2833581 RepID=A0A942UNP5_9BACI|nr:YusW family protein [Lederbergia citrea]MBS4176080.1 YusW family protein [Lederbergia citrea]MBS4222692.1 YusW family protein [Lederbergia citrea]
MKKMIFPFLSLSLVFGLAACSNDPSIDSHPKEQVVPPPPGNGENPHTPEDKSKENSGNLSDGGNVQGDTNAAEKMAELNFTKFNLEVRYGPDKEYDFDYEEKSANGDYKAELNDSIHDKKLKGMEAFNALYTQLKGLGFETNTSEKEAINKILNTFQLDQNYNTFDLEYTLRDGTTVDLEDKK